MKILNFDKALEYAQKMDSENPPIEMNMEDKVDMVNKMEEPSVNIREIIENIQDYINTVLDEVDGIIKNESKLLDEVDIEWDVVEEDGQFCQIRTNSEYKDFSHEQILVVPTRDWEMDKEDLLKYVKAITIREYRDIERNG